MECGREHERDASAFACSACGGNLDVLYDYDRIGDSLSKSSLAADRNLTIWRYRMLLPVECDSPVPPIPVGWTPLHECRRLAQELGIQHLFVKDDGRNPTASFKDRPGALAVVKARESGAKIITTASSGNAGVALAAMCAASGLKSVIFVPASAPPAKIAQLQIYGAAVVLVHGTYDEAFDLCLAAGRRYGWYQRGTGINPFMTEGKKTAAFEIAEQLDWDLPDTVIAGVGDGCIIGGLWKGFNDLSRLGFVSRLPRMVGVQAQGAAAIVDAANGDGIVRSRPASTIADSICVGKPRDARKAIRAMRESGGCGIKVPDEEIVAAIGRLARAAGIFVEPAAAAPLAGLIRMVSSGTIKAEERILLVLTGHGLKDVNAARSACGSPLCITPDPAELHRALEQIHLAD